MINEKIRVRGSFHSRHDPNRYIWQELWLSYPYLCADTSSVINTPFRVIFMYLTWLIYDSIVCWPLTCEQEMIPFAVVGSDQEYQVNGRRLLGRKTKWGTIEGTTLSPLLSFQFSPSSWSLFQDKIRTYLTWKWFCSEENTKGAMGEDLAESVSQWNNAAFSFQTGVVCHAADSGLQLTYSLSDEAWFVYLAPPPHTSPFVSQRMHCGCSQRK